MKNKPTAHKEKNTFKFKSFAEQVADINIAYPHHYLKNSHYYEDEDESTKFCQTLQKWEDFNCSQDFVQLRQKIGSALTVSSLSQLLHRKRELVDLLKTVLAQPQSQAVDVCLELTVSLAHDLQKEFYPHFLELFEVLVKLLGVHDSALIENTFLCLAYLFKSLWRYIVLDFEKIFLLFSQNLLKNTQKDYVQRFAAQCFSFLVRKIEKTDEVIDLIFTETKQKPALSHGIGLLLFESVKSVQNQLHSFSSQFLLKVLHKFVSPHWVDCDNVEKSVTVCFSCIAEHVKPEKSISAWQPLCKVLTNVQHSSGGLLKIIRLMAVMIKYKKCRLVESGDKMLALMTTAIPGAREDPDCLRVVLNCGSALILNLYVSLSTKVIREFCGVVFAPNMQLDIVFCLVKDLLAYPFLERDILPPFLAFYESQVDSVCADSLHYLVEILIQKAQKPLLGRDVGKVYTLRLSEEKSSETFSTRINCALENSESLSELWSCLVCLPHVKPCNEEVCSSTLVSVVNKMYEKLVNNAEGSTIDVQLASYVILEAIYAFILLNGDKVLETVSFNMFTNLLRLHPQESAILQAANFYLEHAKRLKADRAGDAQLLSEVYTTLEQNLSSPYKVTRLLTCRILMLLDTFSCNAPDSDEQEEQSVFSVCFSADTVETTVETYREKLRLLQKLEASSTALRASQERFARSTSAAVRFLCGVLYENFAFLWPPAVKILATHFKDKNFLELWTFLVSHYQETSCLLRSGERGITSDLSFKCLTSKFMSKYIHDVYSLQQGRVDHFNHRLQLIKLMASAADVVERKNRDVIELFFDFLNQEAYVVDISSTNISEDITKEDAMDVDGENDDQEEEENGVQRKNVWRTLIAFLELFSKFQNPKAMSRESEVKKIYCDLLRHRNSELQKAAFNCILTYNFEFITPYKENLQRLIDDKTFKDEVVNFSLNAGNEEDRVVSTEHRKDMIPYLMRILYGKMLSKTGSHSTGKSKGDLRRSVVFRFLAGCSDTEILEFAKLSYAVFEEQLHLNYSEMYNFYQTLDLTKCVPLRKVISATRTLEVMAVNLGNLAKELLPYFFKVLVNVSTLTTTLLQRRDLIKESSVSKLKFLRTECFKLCIKFFKMFDLYNYSDQEIDDIFSALVWPMLPSLSNESLSSPSPLLKLIVSWSENPRYFVLLMKCHKQDRTLYPLSVVIDLYEDYKADTPPVEIISKMLENLVTYESFTSMETDDETVYPISVQDIASVDCSNVNLNYGTQILLPFVPKILKRLKMNFDSRLQQKKKTIITSEELTILMNIAPHVDDENHCKLLASMFIGNFNEKQKRVEEKDCKQLETVLCLVNQLPRLHLDLIYQVIPLFRFLNERSTRLELCSIFESLCKADQKLRYRSEIISMLNAYNPRQPEEPDYSVRMEGFKLASDVLPEDIPKHDQRKSENEEANEQIVSSEVNAIFVSSLVYNCLSTICNFEDLGLREASSGTVRLVIRTLVETGKVSYFRKFCVGELLMKEIKKGLVNKNENTRHEFIIILSSLVQYGKDLHPFLQQLYVLYDEKDEDLDFFSTIRHIQLHRRARTLNKLAKNSYVLKALHAKVLSTFILPIVSSFLLDEKSIKNGYLFGAALDVFGAICRYVNWATYSGLLNHYTQLLTKDYENHKTIVKILSTILINFNYDLSKSVFTDKSSNSACSEDAKNECNTPLFEDEKANEKQILNQVSATNVHQTIVKVILPKLHYYLHNFSHSDYEYDAMKSEYPEDDEIQRVPIAFAIVTLLKNLPQRDEILETNVPSVLLRLCHFLKSKSESIRETARSSLVKVMLCLGPRFFPYMLKEIQVILKRGYQIHVLTFTLNVVLTSLKPQMRPGDLDISLDNLLELCNQEVFSDVSEEKEVAKIVGKVKEAKKSRSFDTYQIIGSLTTESSLAKIFYPLKKILSETHSHKVLRKVTNCLKKLIVGLTENASLSETVLLSFFYGVVHDTIPDLQLKKKETEKADRKAPVRKDIFLVEPPRKKQRVPVKTNLTSNHFVFIQESLLILNVLLKRERLSPSNSEHAALLNPFIPVLTEFTTAQHPKLTSTALKCVNNIITKFPDLEAFKTCANRIKDNLFVLLNKHAGLGSQTGDNQDLVVMCFKTMHHLVSDVPSVTVDETQLQVLLIYAEQYINDNARQSVAFGLLKAILSRKLNCPELKDIMVRMSEMLVQSGQEHVRKQCGQLWLKYLINYVHGKNLVQYITFFVRQLDYEYESGRLAAIELLTAAVTKFPEITVNSILELIFVPVASRLINETSPNCRQLASDLITKLFTRLGLEKRDELYTNMIISWLQQSNSLQRQLGARLASILVDVEGAHFMKRLHSILPLMEQQLNPERYSWLEASLETSDTIQKQNDHLIYQFLVLYQKIVKLSSSVAKEMEYSSEINNILSYIVKEYLVHPHVWIRVTSVNIVSYLFSLYTVEEFVCSMVAPQSSHEFLLIDSESLIWTVCKRFMDLFATVKDYEAVGDQIIRLLVFVGRVFVRLPESWMNEDEHLKRRSKLSLTWLLKRLCRETKREVARNPNVTIRRTLVFKWIAAIVMDIDKDLLEYDLETMITPLCREVTDKSKKEYDDARNSLDLLAQDVLKVIQSRAGNELYNRAYATVVGKLSRTRVKRKTDRAVELLMNPLKGLKRRHKKHVASRESKKRKFAAKRGKKLKKR